ncbi:hypothetical protein [Rhodococcoides fascians]|uniref:hypothetical protein n=1 Tax=Rhodococcoides fascians TaxID=1828 RepID=UPI001E482394|nr:MULTISPECIES: hypothetical protein [Rhodococcus]
MRLNDVLEHRIVGTAEGLVLVHERVRDIGRYRDLGSGAGVDVVHSDCAVHFLHVPRLGIDMEKTDCTGVDDVASSTQKGRGHFRSGECRLHRFGEQVRALIEGRGLNHQ